MKKKSNILEKAALILQALTFLAEIILLIMIVVNRDDSLRTVVLFLVGTVMAIPFIGGAVFRNPNFKIRKIVLAIGVCICIVGIVVYSQYLTSDAGQSFAFAIALLGIIVIQFSIAPEEKR